MRRFYKSVIAATAAATLAACGKDNMTIRKLLEGPEFGRHSTGKITADMRRSPHEIDGDLFPIEEDEEREGRMALHRVNALTEMQPEEVTDTSQGRPWIIKPGDQVGRIVTVPATSAPPAFTEILKLTSGDVNSLFSVTVGQSPDSFGAALGFGSIISAPPVTGAPFQPNAVVVQWGAGGAQFETRVDVDPGQTFTVGGSFLRLVAMNGGTQRPAGTPIPVDIGAFVSLRPRSNGRGAKLTGQAPGPIIANALIAFPMPPFVNLVKFYRAPNTAPITIQFFGIGGVLIGEVPVPAGADCPEVPVPGNLVGAVNVQNGANALTNIIPVYTLSL